MISRILVPKDARLGPAQNSGPDGAPRRVSSDLDERTLVPSNLPYFELDPRTSIPEHLPLDVLSARVVVPRNMPKTPLDATRNTPEYVRMDILQSRVAVPSDAHPQSFQAKALVAIQDLPDVLEPDVITTGEVNLLPAHVEERSSAWTGGDRMSLIGLAASLAAEISVLLIVLFAPPLSHKTSSPEIARDNFTDLYLPPDVKDLTRVAPKPPSPQIKIDPRFLKSIAPPRPFSPPPGPVAPQPPAPQIQAAAPTPAPTIAKPVAPSAQQPTAPVESPIRPQQQDASNGLVLPQFSPGKALQESLHEALKDGGTTSAEFGGPVKPQPVPGGGGGEGGGGGGQGYLGGSLQLLTPTEGVDFSSYLERMKAIVERNWYAVMPESAQLGERGRVVLQFRVMRNGVVPSEEPAMVGSSGKEPLDRAAVSSIRASTPFEPLPPAFSGPFIELRFIFLYNLPLDAQ